MNFHLLGMELFCKDVQKSTVSGVAREVAHSLSTQVI